jgi:hypothetical protein
MAFPDGQQTLSSKRFSRKLKTRRLAMPGFLLMQRAHRRALKSQVS